MTVAESTRLRDYRPPNPPWTRLDAANRPTGYLSFYYSDPYSALPVRWVTRRLDNKSDPNWETGTYGLFSTCERGLRAGLVREGRSFIFFVAEHDGQRCLTGFYEVGWHAEGPPMPGYGGTGMLRDFHLAARRMKFIFPPIPLAAVAERFDDGFFSRHFRTYKKADADQTEQLRSLFKGKWDRTEDYIAEVRRLERLNKRFWGHHYVNWRQDEPFSWDFAVQFLAPIHKMEAGTAATAATSARTGVWRCLNCDNRIYSQSLLKRCPDCRAIGMQVATPPEEA